jgi:hypothetical protein
MLMPQFSELPMKVLAKPLLLVGMPAAFIFCGQSPFMT